MPTESVSLFHPAFVPALLQSVIFAIVAFGLFFIFWKVIDKVTPGNLNIEILGSSQRPPNIALAIVVGSMALGFCIIIAAAIH